MYMTIGCMFTRLYISVYHSLYLGATTIIIIKGTNMIMIARNNCVYVWHGEASLNIVYIAEETRVSCRTSRYYNALDITDDKS